MWLGFTHGRAGFAARVFVSLRQPRRVVANALVRVRPKSLERVTVAAANDAGHRIDQPVEITHRSAELRAVPAEVARMALPENRSLERRRSHNQQ